LNIRLKNQSTRLRLKNKLSTCDLPTPEKIPILIPQKAYDAIKAEGSYEYVEAIEVPTEGTGGIYTKEYFQSLLDYMRQYPMGGNKDGHETSKDDYYTVGGEIQMRSENEGVCYLRVLVPPEDWNGNSNAGLIRSIKAGTQEMSIVANVKPVMGNDGQVYFTKELGRPRNDIVAEGAMQVRIGNSANEKEVMALIAKGAVDIDSESTELVKNGKVYRKAAVALQSTSDKAYAGRVLNAIAAKMKDKNVPKTKPFRRNGMKLFYNAEGGEIPLTLEDVVEWCKKAITNNQLTAEELMKAIGFENKLRNATDEQRVKLVAGIIEALSLPADTSNEDLIKAVQDALKAADEAAETVVEAAANELAEGKKIKNADGTEVDNPVYLYAIEKLKGKRGKQLNSAAEDLKKDQIMISLRSKQADTRVNAETKKGEDTPAAPAPKMKEV